VLECDKLCGTPVLIIGGGDNWIKICNLAYIGTCNSCCCWSCEHYPVVVFEYDVRTPRVARSRYATQLTTWRLPCYRASQDSILFTGLTSALDRSRRIDAFLKKSKRLGYCNANTPPVADLFATADDALFKRMLANQHHVLQPLLPDQSSHNYNLRNRRHQLQLTQKTTHFNNKLFIIRLLFKDTY